MSYRVLACATISVNDGAERLVTYGFGARAMANLCALASDGGVAQLRLLRRTATVTQIGAVFRVEVTDDLPDGYAIDRFNVAIPLPE